LSYLDQKYLGMISGRLRNFRQKDRNLYNFSCPICGDSATDRRKARGYAYEKSGDLMFHCHNCSVSMSVRNLIKQLDPELHSEYMLEKFVDTGRTQIKMDFDSVARQAAAVRKPEGSPMDGLLRVADLPKEHEAVKLAKARRLPEELLSGLYHADDFPGWAGRLTDKFGDAKPEPRFVIPFLDRSGRLYGFQGRAYGDVDARYRYMTVCLDKEPAFLYGFDRVDLDRPIVAVEGPFDSMFVPNGVATAGGSIPRELAKTGLKADRFVVAYDNEPRSVVTVAKMRQAAREGFPVFVWPQSVDCKDFNELVQSRRERLKPLMTEIAEMITKRTFYGLYAELEITDWRRCDG
jgi:hypothetical protein